jgi:hypothetical protein
MRSVFVDVAPRRTARLWLPHQHGAWAMLALPILVGIAASRFVPGQLLLAVTAVAAYLASAALQAWLRARRRPSYVPSIVVYGVATALLGAPLLVIEPRLVLAAIVVVPAGALTLAVARPGTPRELALSLAHVAQASVLVPAAMLLAGETSAWVLGAATAIAAAEMVGSCWRSARSSASATAWASLPVRSDTTRRSPWRRQSSFPRRMPRLAHS